jgi:16S rRNA processing protein RimM
VKSHALVGRIARAHGIRGQVIVNPETDFPLERFHEGAELFVEQAGGVRALRVASVRFQHDRPVLGFDGVETMNDAEALAGLELRVPIDRLMPLPAGSYYHHDLIGCRVETIDGRAIGIVKDVEAATAGKGGGSRLVVDGDGGEILIPLVAEFCKTVDVIGKRIVIDAPAGLLELNSKSG